MHINRVGRRIFFIFLLTFLAACGKQAPSEPPIVEREPIIPETTKVPDKATRDALTVYNIETGEMRFNASTPILDNLKTGDVFVGEPSTNAPVGYLRKVTAIRKDGGEVVLETTQAKLTDAIHQGTLNVKGDVQPSQLRSVTPLMEGAYGGVIEGATDDNQTITGELQPQINLGNGFNFEAGIDGTYKTDDNAPGASASFVASVKGKIKFNVGYRIIIDIGFLADLNYIEASMGFEESVEIALNAEGKGNFKKEWRIAEYDFDNITFFIGPVPIVLVPSAVATLGVDGNMQFKFDYKFSQTAAFVQGVKWDEDDGWSRIDRNEFNVKHEGPNFSGKANFKAYARADLRVLLYDFVGPNIGATVGGKLDVAFPRDPLWILSGFVKGDVGFVLDFLGNESRFEEEIFNIEKEIARGEAKPPTVTILNQNLTVDLLARVNLEQFVKIEDPIGASAAYSSDKDGPIDQPYGYTFTTDGTRTITVTASSNTGKTAQGFFTVNVINTPPSLSEISAPSSIGQGVGWSLSSAAVARDPNEPGGRVDCSRLTWSVTGDEPLRTETGSNKGCDVFIIFSEEDTTREVKVVATDTQGLSTEKTFAVNVTERPANIPPAIQFVRVNTSNGFLQSGGKISFFATPTASVDIYNPTNAPLEYEWSIFGPWVFGFDLGTAATATLSLSEDKYDPDPVNRDYYCSLDGDNNLLTCPARFRVVVTSNGVTVGAKEFNFIIDYTVNPN